MPARLDDSVAQPVAKNIGTNIINIAIVTTNDFFMSSSFLFIKKMIRLKPA
jgi:hypothetical protein